MQNSGFLIGYKTKTGATGASEHAYKNKEFTLKLIECLNKNYTDIKHYIMTAPPNTPFCKITNYSLDNLHIKYI
tara:strand:+ start:212 stop:433 length:222 start_codon:yes stop_codon:yes gene_type:complete